MASRNELLKAATFTARTTGKGIVGLARYASKNHIGGSISFVPGMGFMENLGFVVLQFILGIAACFLAGGIAYLMVGYGMPYLIGFIFHF